MDKAANLTDCRLKDTIGARVGDHQAGEVVLVHRHLGPHILHVDGAVQGSLDRHDLHASHLGRRRIGAVCRERNEANVPDEEKSYRHVLRHVLPLSVTL